MSLFQELKRRNVFRVGIAYLIVAWLVMQVADVMIDNIGAPDWLFQAILLVLAVGFPVALVFAWAFELTPEGIKREAEVDRSQTLTPQTGRKLDRAIIVVLALAVAFLLYQQFSAPERAEPTAAPETSAAESAAATTADPAATEAAREEKSIAVLPFRDMSAAQNQGYFGEGIAEELLNALVKLEGLRVASRTSAFSLADENLDIPAIAARLDVNHILEGSVRTSGNQVRVTAQLIDVADDAHLWSETYNGNLDDIFRIQDEITEKITGAMKVQLSEGGTPSVAGTLTDSAEAYQLYLQGRHFWRQRNSPSLHRAVDLLEKAVEIDPGFSQAWSNLAVAYLNLSDYDRSYDVEESFTNALAAADRALQIDPTSTEARLIKANYTEFHCDFRSAAEQYESAIADDPDDPTARHWYAILLMTTGHIEEAYAQIERAAEIDSLIAAVQAVRAQTLALRGEADESLAAARQAAALGFRSGASEVEAITQIINGNGSRGAELLLGAAYAEDDPQRRELLRLFAQTLTNPDLFAAFRDHIGTAENKRVFYTAEVGDQLALLGSPYLFEYFEGIECPPLDNWHWSPTFRAQRGTPEFLNLMRRMNIVAFWESHGAPDDCASLPAGVAVCAP